MKCLLPAEYGEDLPQAFARMYQATPEWIGFDHEARTILATDENDPRYWEAFETIVNNLTLPGGYTLIYDGALWIHDPLIEAN